MNAAVEMTLHVDTSGAVRCVYGESIDLHALGCPHVTRASYVEPDAAGRWSADMRPLNGPRLESFATRSEALAAERQWLDEHWPPEQAPFLQKKGDPNP